MGDENGNSIQDGDEPGIEDVTLALYKDDELLAQDTTNEEGYYIFDDLCAGEYCVYVTDNYDVLEGLAPTQAPPSCFTLGDDEKKLDQDYGYEPPQPNPKPTPLPCCPPGKYGYYGRACRPCGYAGKRGKRG